MNEEHMNFRLFINNRDNLDFVSNNQIIIIENDDKLPKQMIKIMESFLKGNNFKKQRLSWIEKIICPPVSFPQLARAKFDFWSQV